MPNNINLVIPGMSAEVVNPSPARAFGTAGTIAIVGNFERGNANEPYFFKSALDAQQKMGSSPSYTGSKVIEYASKQDLDNNNYGPTDLICVKAGTTVKASATLLDSSSAIGLHVTAVSGGPWANGATGGLKVSIGSGTISGQKATIKLNGVVIDQPDNCANTTEIMNKINAADNFLVASGTSAELARTLATVTDTALAGGTETASPSTSDLTTALNKITNEDFDIIIFTDTPDPTYLPTVEAWLNVAFEKAKGGIGMFPLATANNVSTTLTNEATADSDFMSFLYQTFDVDNDTLTAAESVARYASFVAGLPVNESPTHKVISDITALNAEYNFGQTDSGYALVDGGVTVFANLDRKNNNYGCVSAVTGIRDVDDNGQKVLTSELYAARIRSFVVKYFNLEAWLGQTGIDNSIESALGELENRKDDLISQKIVKDVIIGMSVDGDNNKLAYADIEIVIPGILKHIHIRVKISGEA